MNIVINPCKSGLLHLSLQLGVSALARGVTNFAEWKALNLAMAPDACGEIVSRDDRLNF